MTFAFSERKKRTDCCGLRINLTLKKKMLLKVNVVYVHVLP